MASDHDAAWQTLREADPAAQLGYDASALALLVAEVRAEALATSTTSIDGILEPQGASSATASDRKKPGWWKRHWRRVLTGAAALTLVGGLTAAGLVVTARTGWFGEPGSENGTSEMIDQRGDDYAQLVKDDEPSGLVYPAGLTSADASEYVLRQFPAGENANLPEDGIRSSYCLYAQALWELMWQRAFEANDVEGQAVALTHIDEAVTCTNNYNSWGEGLYDFLMSRQAAARSGDPAPLLQDIKKVPEIRGILAKALESAR
ncbi:hypothetical protein [Arthrobacter psychrolactophilus]